ncbi:alpha/beta hydrolase [Paenibacillus sp. HB172176]|uniref:alpha/beta hydrolase family protein n=1 Tax=Paenibacillus sp. HB172176 TaxID=2493690 RepID=UPI00143A8372|nr:alpha/beta hydrolase [Paenibacillus sp. HB172176]
MEEIVKTAFGQKHGIRRIARKASRWMHSRYLRRLAGEGFVSRFAEGGLLLFGSAAMAAVALGIPTGLGIWIDLLLMIGIHLGIMLLTGYGLTILLSFLYLPLPRRLTAYWIYLIIEVGIILYYADFDPLASMALAGGYASIGLIIGLSAGAIWRLKLRVLPRLLLWGSVAAILGILSQAWSFVQPESLPTRASSIIEQSEFAAMPASKLEDPSQPGSFDYIAFSYGSGKDKHRDLFGKDVNLVSNSVDASSYITYWPKLKTWFWGFDQHDLPINGRVWMPEGDGPFPLALIVHGNHLMEDFSDGGYAYLGELLASRGFIAVSVDANFFNYSVWSSIPNDDMMMRAWLMLKHLQQIQSFSEEEGTLFSGKVDWKKIALIGHSRGAQAVAMAADSDRWFEEDSTLESLSEVHIASVVSIAPTDKIVDNKSAELLDINYLTLQGASDADVNQFTGDRQYNRTAFSLGSDRFKALLYIKDANHSQFNSSWGSMDERLPGGLFLNKHGLLEPRQQRQIAKVYISAFLESTLQGKEGYRALFQNQEIGRDWLPDTAYVSRYDSGDMFTVENFEEVALDSNSYETRGMMSVLEATAKDRDGKSKGTSGMELTWEAAGASYEQLLSKSQQARLNDFAGGSLVFSITNLEAELLEHRSEEEKDDTGFATSTSELPMLPELEISLQLASGELLSSSLQALMPVKSPFYHAYLNWDWLEHRYLNNKFRRSSEAVSQTYIIPFDQFQLSASPGSILSIKVTMLSDNGKILLDDIGFLPEGGTYIEFG